MECQDELGKVSSAAWKFGERSQKDMPAKMALVRKHCGIILAAYLEEREVNIDEYVKQFEEGKEA
jgi:predicted GNAT superfamily acetyltransferase